MFHRVITIGRREETDEKYMLKLWVSNTNPNIVSLKYRKDGVLVSKIVSKGFTGNILLRFVLQSW